MRPLGDLFALAAGISPAVDGGVVTLCLKGLQLLLKACSNYL